jgi:membrane fusion protein, multidrug efflux system
VNRQRQRRFAAIATLVLVVAVLAWWARAQSPSPMHPTDGAAPGTVAPRPAASPQSGGGGAPVQVVLAPVVLRDTVQTLQLPGSGRAPRETALQPAVAGQVERVALQAGRRVAAGELLVQLVDRPQRIAVAQAEAALEAARRLAARYERTDGSGAIPASVIDDARHAVRVAELALEAAREALADRALRAPFAGVVGLAAVSVGDRVGTDTVLGTLDDRRVLWVDFALPEQHLSQVAPGRPLEVQTPAWRGERFAGRVLEVDSRVDATTRAVRVRAEVPNRADRLRPGMSFEVALGLPGQGLRPAVPELALQWGREGAYVWAVREGVARQVAVRVLQRVGEEVWLEAALGEGDRVVVEGVQRLREGRRVQPLGERTGTAPAAASAAAVPAGVQR